MKPKLSALFFAIVSGFLLALFSVGGSSVAQELVAEAPAKTNAVPIRVILAEEVVQESINLVRFATNSFAVRFTYTEAGAKKELAFRNAHDGQEIMTKVGSFESRSTIWPRDSYPPEWKNDEGWLKRRTTKVICKSEDDAMKLVAGLKGKNL